MNYIYILVLLLVLMIWIPWFWRYHWRPHLAKRKIQQRLNTNPDKKKFEKTVRLLTMLYKKVNSTGVSSNDRQRLKIESDDFIYGEVEFSSFMIILDKVKPRPGEIFYDLGSGAGKAVFTAALNYDLSKACGVELLPGLHVLAEAQIKKAKKLIQQYDEKLSGRYLFRLSCIQFINDNFLNVDFSAADIVFINATCLHYLTWEKISAKLADLKSGSRVIVLTKKIKNNQFKLIHHGLELMSWGMNSVNIYCKTEA